MGKEYAMLRERIANTTNQTNAIAWGNIANMANLFKLLTTGKARKQKQ